ncbi:MAG: hypothetical protein GXO47_09880 [Chlorobi bacterium]|nr:hypothetical protein [Chlorobiota bacterium]
MSIYRIIAVLTLVLMFTGCSDDDEWVDIYHIDYVPQWSVDNSKYEHSMQVICILKYNNDVLDDENDMVAAFINDECVGYTKPVVNEATGQNVFLLTVFGNSTDDIVTFKMYDAKNSRLFDADNELQFEPSGVVQSVSDPLEIIKTDT